MKQKTLVFACLVILLAGCQPQQTVISGEKRSGSNQIEGNINEAMPTDAEVPGSSASPSPETAISQPLTLATVFAQSSAQAGSSIAATWTPVLAMTATSRPVINISPTPRKVYPTPTRLLPTSNPLTVTPYPTLSLRPTVTKTPIPGSIVCVPTGNQKIESELLLLINAERAKIGVAPLVMQIQLIVAARLHSEDMACNDFFSHYSLENGTLYDRITEAGYSFSVAGENIAAGYTLAADIFQGWMHSASHKDNMLNSDYTVVGLGYAVYDQSEYHTYMTAVFAAP